MRHFEKARALANELGDQRHEAETLWLLAILNADLGRSAEAGAAGEAAIHIWRHTGNPSAAECAAYLEKYRRDGADARLQAAPAAAGNVHPGYVTAAQPATPVDPTRQRGPGFLRMALAAVMAVGRFVGSGFKTVSDSTYQQRLATCATCPQHTGERCKACGCFTKVKAKLPHETCPMAKWPPSA